MIKKIKGQYVVLSRTTGRRFGTYRTKGEAVHRLQQVEFFKRLALHPSARATRRGRGFGKKGFSISK